MGVVLYMKIKRLLSLALLLATVFCFAFTPAKTVKASAAVVDIVRISGYQYTLNEILSAAGAGSSTSKTVKYRLSQLPDGTAVSETDSQYKEAAFITADSTVEFLREGVYTFEVYTSSQVLENTFKVETKAYDSIDESSMRYVMDSAKITAVKDAINAQAQKLSVKDSFSFTDSALITALDGVIKSDYFAYSSLTKNYFYLAPGAESYTSTTSSSFKLSSAGTYSIYVLVKDEFKNSMTTTDLVIGENGWYADDGNGNPTGDVIVPIFTFNVEKITAPEITVATSESGFLNLEYYVKAFTVSSDDYDAEYTLYYCEKEYDKDDESFANDDAYINAVKNDATTVDVTEELFNEDKLSFTPNKKGYYYVLIRAVDSANMGEEAMSRSISVQREFTTVKVENEFFKNNVISVVFLSISLVCAIALVCLICIKPKEVDVDIETK